MSNFVLVIDTTKKPLNPVHPAVARKLLSDKKAAVFRRYPFTIILNVVVTGAETQPIQLKIDPGSKTTGIALVQNNKVIFGAELTHRGFAIKSALQSRKQLRSSRRNRKTRYRKARFLNRHSKEGWLAPSLEHRVHTTITWVKRLSKFARVTEIFQELVKFDLQQLENPEISGIEYQQGELQGYEVREYLLEKWNRKCAYCGAEGVPLQIEHIRPKVKGGSNRISNLTLACEKCNQKKGSQDIEVFLKKKPETLKKVLYNAKKPLKDATAVNATRWKLFNSLKALLLPVTVASGGKTKANRIRLNLQKAHWLDAACVGDVDSLRVVVKQPLLIKANGHGTRQMCGTNKYGFPTRHSSRIKIHFDFQTGDIVKAIVTKGKKKGRYVGRIATRATGSFNILDKTGLIQGISYKNCKIIHKKDGYSYCD